MRMPKRGEKGFTLIELLIVVAILGVLAAVIIPNVGRFIGAGEAESKDTEFSNVQTAEVAMMVDNQLSTLPVPVAVSTNLMNAFPDATTTAAAKGTAAFTGTKLGYLLYQHEIIVDVDGDGVYDVGDGDGVTLVNYVATNQTAYFYTVYPDGTVHQHDTAGEARP